MTTLQLAEAIARAILAEVDEQGTDDGSDFGFLMPHNEYFPATWQEDVLGQEDLSLIVLKVLRDNDCWFCRIQEGPAPVGGIVQSEQMELTFDANQRQAEAMIAEREK